MLMSVPFEHFKELLLNEQQRLMSQLNLISISIKNGNGGSGCNECLEDQIADMIEMKRKEALSANIKEKLNDVNHALLKLTKGSYGYCDICGKDIPVKRLEALPQASLCLDCKKRLSGHNRYPIYNNNANIPAKELYYQPDILESEVETDQFMNYKIYGDFE